MPAKVRGGHGFPPPAQWGDEKFSDEQLPKELANLVRHPEEAPDWSPREMRDIVRALGRALGRGRERSGKFFDKAAEHRTKLARAIADVGEVAFSHLSYYNALAATTTINTIGGSATMTRANLTVPVASRAHVLVTATVEADVPGAGVALWCQIRRNVNGVGAVIWARSEYLCSTAGDVDSMVTQYLFQDLEPGNIYQFDARFRLSVAGATYLVYGTDAIGHDRTNMTIRIEPRIKVE